MESLNQQSEKYVYAQKRLKSLKGFYTHFAIYVIVNVMIIFGTFYDRNFNFNTFWSWDTFATPIFWGIGLIAHGSSVFGKNLIFSKNWENRKINEYMEKDKKTGWE